MNIQSRKALCRFQIPYCQRVTGCTHSNREHSGFFSAIGTAQNFCFDKLVHVLTGNGAQDKSPFGLAKRRRKKTQAENLRLRLATTSVDLRSLWSRSNLHGSQHKFFTVWPPNASQHKSCGLFWQIACTCESVWPPNASLYASSACNYLRPHALRFG